MSKRIVARRHMFVHRIHHVLIGMGASYLEHAWVSRKNTVGSSAQAARDDDAAVSLQGLADGVQ